ncbi:MAG: protein translocase subunit SecD [Candidatus Omnitrophota bacterium]
MRKGVIWKILLVLVLVFISLWLVYPPFDIKDKDGNIIKEGKIKLGLDLQGGMHLILKVDTSKIPEDARKDAADRALEVIRNRIDEFGVREPVILRQGQDEIVVQLPGITDRDRALELIGKTALLEFKLASDDPERLSKALQGEVPAGYELLKDEDESPILLEKEAVLTGDALTTAFFSFQESHFNEPYVSLQFNEKGAKKFAKVTKENVGKRLAIVLDGKVQSAPVIREAIPSGQAQISGRFTREQASDLAIVLKVGALPAPVYIEEERTIGPLLGQDSIRSGIRATLTGALIVVVFMLVYYLIAGLVADIALVLNLVFLLGALAYFHASLSLPGIAGIILTLGMAVDANVLIDERIREELKAGKSLAQSIHLGYDKAFSAIVDSNLTTLVAAFFLFQFGTGPIRGFAITLTIGIVISLFTAVFVTRVVFDLLLRSKGFKKLHMLHLIGDTKINFIGKRWLCYLISSVIIVIGAVVFFARGESSYGIDFTGGQVQEFNFNKPPKVDDIRSALREINLGNAAIQQIKENPRDIIIRTSTDSIKDISKKLEETFKDNKSEIIRVEKVGPSVGHQLRMKAIYAMLCSLLGILIYVAFRFKHWNFAVAGVIALFHDVFVAVAFMAFTHREISLTVVAALLTIAGYSINDTIVIYDRIRENTRSHPKMALADLINLSVNQTLSRTLLTTLTVLIVACVLFVYGGEVLNDFAFCLMVGFISGVYSTVYIASPLIIAFRGKRKL